ncbi:pyridoxal 5'-phosphate synthase glutaminase subunit PdxT [candidate division KSB1 bacterium]|nr:MAG: pyridoxal 5'-phosphate synthase glutaminase subunit PdxT [candidate division KSB1 bacterium]
MSGVLTVGVLALQGDFERHARAFEILNRSVREVRRAEDLDGLSALVIPGGESTTMTLLLTPKLRDAVVEFCRNHPTWGTCAGMIMLSKDSRDPRVKPLGFMDIEVERNGYGRQVHSFEADLRVAEEIGESHKPLRGIFIRAPRLTGFSPDVQPLVWHGEDIVCARQNHFLVSAFHPELMDDLRLQKYFLAMKA